MRIAHVLHNGVSTLALWKNGHLLDVQKLEELLHIETSPLPFSPRAADFHVRMFSLGGAGLVELNESLDDGYLPKEALLPTDSCIFLPPIGKHAALLEFSVRAEDRVPRFRWGNARGLVGHDSPLLLPPDEPAPQVSAQIAAILGDDVHHASVETAERSIAGFALMSMWKMPSRDRVSPGWGSFRIGQIGPTLLLHAPLDLPEQLDVSILANGERMVVARAHEWRQSFAEMIAFASEASELHAGDIISSGPLARLSSNGGRTLQDGDKITIETEYLGKLTGSLLVSDRPSQFLNSKKR